MDWHITSFYRFLKLSLDDLDSIQSLLAGAMQELEMVGLIVLAEEGINGTVSGSGQAVATFKSHMADLIPVDIRFKDSIAKRAPFKKISVIRRPEIVSLKRPELAPRDGDNTYLSSSEWQAMLENGAPKIVIDTRNRYETKVGTFRGAVDPNMGAFSEWPDFVDSLDVSPDTPVLIFCTGGIRCEKAALVLQAKGISKVYQLRDGILGYLAQYPDSHFEGECFVFDERVAVDGSLRPSERFGLCVGCGDPTAARSICRVCGESFPSCEACGAPCCSKACNTGSERAVQKGPTFHR